METTRARLKTVRMLLKADRLRCEHLQKASRERNSLTEWDMRDRWSCFGITGPTAIHRFCVGVIPRRCDMLGIRIVQGRAAL